MIRSLSLYFGLSSLLLAVSIFGILFPVDVFADPPDPAPHRAVGADESNFLQPTIAEVAAISSADGSGLDEDTIPEPQLTSSESVIVGLPIHLPLAEAVKDPIFSILIALVDNDIYGTLSQSRLKSEIERRGLSSKLPYERVKQVTRLPVGGDRTTTEVRVNFDGHIKLPIPYSILGYNPGSFRAAPVCRFREWKLGDFVLAHPIKNGDKWEKERVELKDVSLFGLAEGEIFLDIDGWLDGLLGGKLDDTSITALMLCRYEGDWHGFAMGYTESKKGRSGALNFRKDKVVFPSPAQIKTIGRKMRAKVERMMVAAEG